MANSHPARGSALMISIIVVLVITVLAVGAVRFASQEVAGAIVDRKDAAVASCAEAARARLLSELRLLGQVSITDIELLDEELEDTTPTLLRGGHYGEDPEVSVRSVQLRRLNDMTTGPSFSANDLTNRIGDTVGNYRVVVHCIQGRPPNDRQLEIEFGLQYGL
ncbi:MAG TPA: hypothetical protein VEB43_12715 [Anaeromyxobacter sp.]|nr:hypothetical protein [Anaeromyxobacter sp.]